MSTMGFEGARSQPPACKHGVTRSPGCKACMAEVLRDVLRWMEDAGMPFDEDESALMTRISSVLDNGRELP